jgi:uncharacterized protein YecE (DUF72 family)
MPAPARPRPSPVLVGTAGWATPRQHAALFGAGASGLARYATRFDAVEINTSFYRPHQRKTYAHWAASVPARFRFAVKLPKAITHDAGLRGAGAALDRFAGEVDGLDDKLAVVLVQLPPSRAFEPRVAATFFAMLRRRFDCGLACEPRHASWFGATADALWEKHAIARVAADPARLPEAARAAGAGPWRYWRWHGSPVIYRSGYDDAALRALAASVRAQTPRGARAFVVFDNTTLGHAAGDAARFDALAAEPRRPTKMNMKTKKTRTTTRTR